MPKPENFFDRLREFSGFRVGTGKEEIENRAFWIDGIRLQDDGIAVELLDEEGDECEFFIGIDDLVDGFEDFIVYSHPEDAAEYKATTLDALRKAIERIERMEPWKPNAEVSGRPHHETKKE